MTFSMPPIGLGTFLMDRNHVTSALQTALDIGYRRIDCAPVYFNEDVVGDALYDILKQGLVPRRDLFVLSKLASPFHSPQHVEMACRKTLADLRLDYLDLYLVHWPVAFKHVPLDLTTRGYPDEEIDNSAGGLNIDETVSIHDTWQAMERLVQTGLVRAIGVSNFPVMLLHELLSKATIPPVVNQCERHPYLQQTRLVQYCLRRGIHFQAYSPLGTPGFRESAEPNVLQDPTLVQIARRHNVTTAEISIAWAFQSVAQSNSSSMMSIVTKSTSPLHQRLNFEAAAESGSDRAQRIVLSTEDLEEIAKLDRGYRYFRPEEWWDKKPVPVFD
jgi:alcohol dehydrogenase (NADP+)